jgi:flagellar basal body rod protein FlgG
MIRGIYCSNTGLNALQKKMDVIGNNIANVNTQGFKQVKISIITFKEEINGVIAGDTKTDLSAGSLVKTDNGFIESSNVDLIQNMADMITTARSFSLNSRMITSEDDMLKKAAEQVGTLK